MVSAVVRGRPRMVRMPSAPLICWLSRVWTSRHALQLRVVLQQGGLDLRIAHRRLPPSHRNSSGQVRTRSIGVPVGRSPFVGHTNPACAVFGHSPDRQTVTNLPGGTCIAASSSAAICSGFPWPPPRPSAVCIRPWRSAVMRRPAWRRRHACSAVTGLTQRGASPRLAPRAAGSTRYPSAAECPRFANFLTWTIQITTGERHPFRCQIVSSPGHSTRSRLHELQALLVGRQP
jgi:hypothetical protein